MVFILGLVLLQVLRPIPGPSSPHNMTSSPEVQTIVPDNALQPGGSTYGGNLGPLPSGPVVETLSDSFHPSIAVIIGVLSTMFSLTFLILLYAKHCKRASVTMYGGVDHDIIATPALASALFTDRDSGLDRAVVEALPMFSFSALKGMKEGLECAVCLSKYESPELLRLLPQCKHAFHLDCVDVWLNHHSTCPLCRHRVDAQDTLIVEDFLSAFVKPASEAGGSFRNSARISLSDLTSENPDRTFEFYVQREADIPDLGGCWPHSSGGSWRKDAASIGSDRKLGSWRRDNFSGQIGASERKEGSARVVRSSQASQRKTLDTDHAAVLPLNFAGDAHLDYYHDEQLARRLGHRIIVSDVLFQHRWSDFLPSDVSFFNGSTVHLRQQSMSSVPVSSELAKDPGAGGDSFSAKEDVEMGLKCGGETILHEKTTVTGGSARMSNSKVADVEAALAQLQASAASAEISRAASKQGSMERKERQIKVNNSKGERGWVAGQQRCMSEMSGLQRVQQVAAGKQLLSESEAVEEAEDETTRRWFATARRTIKWLMGSNAGVRPTSSAAIAIPPAD